MMLFIGRLCQFLLATVVDVFTVFAARAVCFPLQDRMIRAATHTSKGIDFTLFFFLHYFDCF